MTREELEKMKPAQLKEFAAGLGVKHHHNAGVAKIVDAIMAAVEGEPQTDESIAEQIIDTALKFTDVAGQEFEPDAEGPTVDQVLTGELDESPVPHKPAVVLSVVSEEIKKNKLEEIIKKEITQWPTVQQARDALAPYVARGVNIVKLDAEFWHLRVHNREASGNLKLPLKILKDQAELLLKATGKPTEGLDIEEILTMKLPRR